MTQAKLDKFLHETLKKSKIPGAAVGVWAEGKEIYGSHGVTSTENPVPVDQNTLFILASITKTYTATALMRLVAEGKVELDAPVRRYVPELQLKDGRAETITVLNLLNHTAGFDWRLNADTGEGDDALARWVARLSELALLFPPNTRPAYSQAGFNLAGRVIEKVTGKTYEAAMAELVLEPLGLDHSLFVRDDIMTRRFSVGHNLGQDGTLSIAHPWRNYRAENPGGGLASSVSDQLRWAKFHMGDGRAEGGEQVLPKVVLDQMKQATVELRASSLGDAIGISWFLREIEGVATISHAGSANGQFAELLMVPERNFAVVSVCNLGPDDGLQFNRMAVRWALENYLGIIDRDPEPIPFDPARAQEIVGHYANAIMTFDVTIQDASKLILEVRIKPEVREGSPTPLPPDLPPAEFGLLPGDQDEYIVLEGGLKGQLGFFTRDTSGNVVAVDLATRSFARESTT